MSADYISRGAIDLYRSISIVSFQLKFQFSYIMVLGHFYIISVKLIRWVYKLGAQFWEPISGFTHVESFVVVYKYCGR